MHEIRYLTCVFQCHVIRSIYTSIKVMVGGGGVKPAWLAGTFCGANGDGGFLEKGYRPLCSLETRHIAARDLVYKGRVGIEQHDVKMLHRLDRLEVAPVLEPYYLWVR